MKREVPGISTPTSPIEAQREMQGEPPLQGKLNMQNEKQGPHLAENHELRFLREWLKKGEHMILGMAMTLKKSEKQAISCHSLR